MDPSLLISMASLVVALAALLVANQQLSHAKTKDNIYQLRINFQQAKLDLSQVPEIPEGMLIGYTVRIEHVGYETLHGLKIFFCYGNEGKSIPLCRNIILGPGQTTKRELVLSADLFQANTETFYLHVAWVNPYLSRPGALRHSAVQVDLSDHVREWHWCKFQRLRHRLRMSPGKWQHQADQGRTRRLPGWPVEAHVVREPASEEAVIAVDYAKLGLVSGMD